MRTHAVILFCLLLLTQASYANTIELLPLEDFAKLPLVSNPKFSPDGKRIAMLVNVKGKPILMVTPFAKEIAEEPAGKISVGELYVHDYNWANNTRLILTVRGTSTFRGRLISLTRLLAVDINGKNPVPFTMEKNQWGFYRQLPNLLNPLHNDDEHVLALLDDIKNGWHRPHVHKVNIHTGKKKFHQKNINRIQYWLADGKGNVLVGQKFGTWGRSDAKTYYRASDKDNWQVLQKTDYFDHDRLLPYKIDQQRPHILVMSRRDLHEGYRGIVDETEQELLEYDLNQGKIIGRYENKPLARVKNAVKKALPDLTVKFQSTDLKQENFIFRAFSDTVPDTYYIANLKDKKFQKLGQKYPSLHDKPLANMKEISYVARDGLHIPAFVTTPNGAAEQNLPLIVYPHGGPWSHDEWGFNPYVQFFANRGYAVFQPQFRGSTGNGIEHEEAGYGEWGAAIQDDITDGVNYLIKSGLADPDRICIVGASFGGYATSMGLVKTPAVYRCGISINGVHNLVKLYGSGGHVLYSAINRKMWNDPDNLARFSPAHNTEKITAPLLLIACKKDSIVPYTHSKRLFKKMKKAGQNVEYLELDNCEHWRTSEPTEITTLRAVEAFLNIHLPIEVSVTRGVSKQ